MKNIIVREYLESLTERDELDYIFTILLEVMDFKIISKPKDTKGLAQYGKDVVAIGIDNDGIKKRFYFEVKGGADRHVTTFTYNKSDGIRESIIEAKDRPYRDTSNTEFNSLPVKIILVHNGNMHPSVKETFDGFIEREFPRINRRAMRFFKSIFNRNRINDENLFEFERWDLYTLTELFTYYLFNEYLLTDDTAIKQFKKVLVLINTPRNNYADYFSLIDSIFEKAGNYSDMGVRTRILFFETLKLISFIIYSYSKDAGNLNAAKRCLPYSLLKLWRWILINNIEEDSKVINQFKKQFEIFERMLEEYYSKTIPVAVLKNGLWSSAGGRFEQIGYPMRTLDYICYLILYFECQSEKSKHEFLNEFVSVLNNNDAATRALMDNHSIPMGLVLDYFISIGRNDDAKAYLRNCIASLVVAWRTSSRLPDGRNQLESIIRYAVTNKKSVYYDEKTSHLMGMFFRYIGILDMKEDYYAFKDFIKEIDIYVAVFVPFTDDEFMMHLPAVVGSHELNLFDHELRQEGYQRGITLNENFEVFKSEILENTEFIYSYRTNKVGFGKLLKLAHIYFKTPFFYT